MRPEFVAQLIHFLKPRLQQRGVPRLPDGCYSAARVLSVRRSGPWSEEGYDGCMVAAKFRIGRAEFAFGDDQGCRIQTGLPRGATRYISAASGSNNAWMSARAFRTPRTQATKSCKIEEGGDHLTRFVEAAAPTSAPAVPHGFGTCRQNDRPKGGRNILR